VHQILKTYQKRLANLTANNRSLLLLKLYRGAFVDLHDFDFLEKKSSFDFVRNLLARKSHTTICSTLDSRDKNANWLSEQLKKVQRKDRQIFEETGAKDLYVGYPFVEGKLLDDTLVRCPLLFFPVELQVKGNKWVLAMRQDVGITFNKSFLLAFSHYNRTIFEDSFLDKNFEDWDKDPTKFLTELYHFLEQSPLELHFNQETFGERLDVFSSHTKAEFEQNQETGRLKLQSEAVLGLFPQAGSFLDPDYERLIGDGSIKDLEEFFHSGIDTSYHNLNKKILEEDIFAPYDLDASQEKALKDIKKGNSLVVQGPPGTGKSQLICNLIGDYIARGKKVLVVCQKRAALDVVYARLAKKGLSDFAALVHDFRHDRKEIYSQIENQISRIEEYKKQNNGLDTIHLERVFLQTSREIDRISETLEDFKQALYEENQCGISVKELYLTSDRDADFVDLETDFKQFNFKTYHTFLRTLEAYIDYALVLDRDGYVWKDRVSFAEFGLKDLKNIQNLIAQIPTWKVETLQKIEQHLSLQVGFEDCQKMLSQGNVGTELLEILEDSKVFLHFKSVLKAQNTELSWLQSRKDVILQCFDEGVESTIAKNEIAEAQEILYQYKKATGKLYSKLYWKFFSKDKKEFVEKLIEKNQLSDNPNAVDVLLARIDKRMNLEHNLSTLQQADWTLEMPSDYRKESFQNWFTALETALQAKSIFQSLKYATSELNIEALTYKQLREHLIELYRILKQIPKKFAQWNEYLHQKQIYWILEGNSKTQKLSLALEQNFDILCEFDIIKSQLQIHEKNVILKLKNKQGQFDTKKTPFLFENSLRLAWINHIEEQYPVLRSLSSPKFKRLERDLQKTVAKKAEISTEILLLKAREQTYTQVKYNRLKNRITYRELEHQVKKKRSIWALRKVISEFSDELFNLIPCWLASPESVSAIFPMQQFFDLVIFDEASQCFAEKGIPAIYRSRQTVIVGDTQQLRPHDLYRPRWEEEFEEQNEGENLAVLEVDSLLDLGKQYLREEQLKGHYRSKSLELIAFSNEHFYQNKLKMIPEYREFMTGQPAIEYIKVDGMWHKNTNQEEAMKIVQLVKGLLAEDKTDIGIITFNFKQQQLIQDLLDLLEINLPESLFVKNIENVQGDERDIIIFSVGYAPNPQGKFSVQFGLLNQQGGENRLNVAVSRAREQIILVSSILPHQLNVDETKNKGPKLLKKYLQYAYEISEGKFQFDLESEQSKSLNWYLKQQIITQYSHAKLEIDENLAFADLAIKTEGKIKLIRTDDDKYFSALSQKESHVYLPALLKSKNWEFTDLYSRNHWAKAKQEQEDLEKFFELK
jgi:superfamily I DNA and/or RNA helicase